MMSNVANTQVSRFNASQTPKPQEFVIPLKQLKAPTSQCKQNSDLKKFTTQRVEVPIDYRSPRTESSDSYKYQDKKLAPRQALTTKLRNSRNSMTRKTEVKSSLGGPVSLDSKESEQETNEKLRALVRNARLAGTSGNIIQGQISMDGCPPSRSSQNFRGAIY